MRSVIRLTFILACFAASPAPAADDEFSDFIADVSREAAQKGVAAHHLRALAELTPDPEVLRLAARQPEYVKPIWAYLLQMVTPKRIALGRAQLAEREVFLGALEEKYGVPREILVAIWGVETNYGSNKGSHSMLQALATLGYTGKRADFGRQQLLSALQILQSGDVALQDFKGSWAGAMGHTQFIPTTYEGYAVDGSGDGVRDIWTEPEDALASSAHYLKRMGWRRDLDWGFEVRVPDDFDFSLAKLKQPKPAAFWRESGVQVLFSERRAREITDGL
ncbi:MAG: lytic murein transglycosylase, partial [Rhodobiaceae bacterium]|nr:lytic murein transglycosylase [Rhodobiaceae bacterium]